MPIKPVSLSSLRFSLLGPGRVGTSLAHWLVEKGAGLDEVSSRNRGSASHLLAQLGGSWTAADDLQTAGSDLLLVAVADPDLAEVAASLARRPQATVVLHTSGRHTAESLAALRRHGSAVGSLHPLMSFPRVFQEASDAAEVVWGCDGDGEARALATRIVDALSGVSLEIPGAARSHYHLAATMAAGGVVTLLAGAADLARRAGLDVRVVSGYLHLARGALENAARSTRVTDAITGPIARGDVRGLLEQIEAARALDSELADFLEVLARRTQTCLASDREDPQLPRS